MFENVSKKIKTLSYVFVVIECIVSLFWAFALFGEEEVLLGLLVLVILPLCMWMTNLFTYGFAEIIENLQLANRQRAEVIKLLRKNNE